MRSFFSILIIICFLSSYAQEDSYKTELQRLEQKLNNVNQFGLKIPVYKDIIELSFPDHLEEVLQNSEELLKLSESVPPLQSKALTVTAYVPALGHA